MKKRIILLLITFSILSIFSGCTENSLVKEFGGKMTIELEPGNKLEEITWKDANLWILTRPMKENEEAETHTFYEFSEFHVFEGEVTVIEKESN